MPVKQGNTSIAELQLSEVERGRHLSIDRRPFVIRGGGHDAASSSSVAVLRYLLQHPCVHSASCNDRAGMRTMESVMQARLQTGLLVANGRDRQALPGWKIWQAMPMYRSTNLICHLLYKGLQISVVY